ncbi:MAG: hypothetical protein H0W94_05095 [Actinobacteria bacterium]|nr:hypothetical protein [Actinomycetota bacterium]
MPGPRLPLRSSSIAICLTFTLAACGNGGDGSGQNGPSANGGGELSIAQLKEGATLVSLIPAQSQLPVGPGPFTFGLVTSGGDLLTGGAPQVFLATDETSRVIGPFTASFHRFTAFERFPNSAPRTPLTGFYSVDVDVPRPGNWLFAGVAEEGATHSVGTALVTVTEGPQAGQVGTEALTTATPVATTDEGRRKICTREPPDAMHYISLDDALQNGKPTVVNFGTPLLCTSRMCGPVVDEQLAVFEAVGPDRANFIHVEVYPERDQERPAPVFLEWGFDTEPITLVIDGEGMIRSRFEGPVTADQIQAALDPLL